MATPEMKAGDRTLSRAATLVNDAHGDFRRQASALSDHLLAQQARWQGQGGRAFTRLHQAWTEKQDRIVNALNEFEASLRSTERDLVHTDQTQSDHLTKHHDRLGGIAQY
ncbi:MAG TPA: WXG100 family type VII secretion target [Nocardioides sp.]|uniref:WXG100 family type VII secretion target n=1 Tax=uncultured Nocardioides sp. TaxID=198441 RepID=UPI002635B7AA|nr:WXG100 family type VII secretion target [uncultured Nocardioides sp.]HRD60783.1 WXG100 family type VII secretion target [Nocardioides sp.]HRI96482.1 WXG100 family type VII secretion target [Nocardioides sp.]HRK47598.1 WXG100 family type VII secretion target [Nocardioides sp.]